MGEDAVWYPTSVLLIRDSLALLQNCGNFGGKKKSEGGSRGGH